MGGQDKQGFGMKQGVLTPGRVSLLMTPGDSCFRGFGRRNGERRRKSVRGCIVSQDLSVLNLAIVKKGEAQSSSAFRGYVLNYADLLLGKERAEARGVVSHDSLKGPVLASKSCAQCNGGWTGRRDCMRLQCMCLDSG